MRLFCFLGFLSSVFVIFHSSAECNEINNRASNTAIDVCDTSRIYNTPDGYSYSLPEKILTSYLSGVAFDNKTAYSEEEFALLQKDINNLYKKILSKDPVKDKLAVMTAGAPGSGKTLLMRQELEKDRVFGKNYAYIDPDDVCLKNQFLTYLADIEKSDQSKEARFTCYNKWRPASNAATHLILANLIHDQYGFYFGTTSSGPQTNKFLEFLKGRGYQIRIFYISAPDDVRWGSIEERDKTFIQTTQTDVIEKAYLLPPRWVDAFFPYADEIKGYWRDGVKENAEHAFTWTRNPPGSEHLGNLEIHSEALYEKIKTIHNQAIAKLNRRDLDWDLIMKEHSQTISQ